MERILAQPSWGVWCERTHFPGDTSYPPAQMREVGVGWSVEDVKVGGWAGWVQGRLKAKLDGLDVMESPL